MPGATLPVPTTEAPRKCSIWDIPFDHDWALYSDSPTLSHAFDDVDLGDITMRGVSKAVSFREQEYNPAILMYHPYDKAEAQTYPQPFEWEKMFDDLASLPSRARSPSLTSVGTMNTTAPEVSTSRRGSSRQFTPCGDVSTFSDGSFPSRRSSNVDSISRRSCRQDFFAYPAHRQLSALLASFSFCRSQESLSQSSRFSEGVSPLSRRTSRTSLSFAQTGTTTGTSSSRSASSLHPHAPRRRRKSSSSKRHNALLLSHIGAGLTSYRMDSHSAELQEVVNGIPISAFIHPRMHIPGGAEYGPVEEDGLYSDAYPLRYTKQWSFDEVSPADQQNDLDMVGVEWDSVIGVEDGASLFDAV